ncbi:MAG TPA: Rrf2 family transcriptional regulator [Longimicrobiales bacterium]|nr:Rrf2 family transcriptional regulator [Longimicrobiales bacterium]
MLTPTAEHALRAVIFLARQPDDRPLAADVVAAALGAPTNCLAKTLGALSAAGIIRGRRGPRGGYRLLMSPDCLTIGDIADLFEPEQGIAACLLGGKPCDATNPCGAHFRWHTGGTRRRNRCAPRPSRTCSVGGLAGNQHLNLT